VPGVWGPYFSACAELLVEEAGQVCWQVQAIDHLVLMHYPASTEG